MLDDDVLYREQEQPENQDGGATGGAGHVIENAGYHVDSREQYEKRSLGDHEYLKNEFLWLV